MILHGSITLSVARALVLTATAALGAWGCNSKVKSNARGEGVVEGEVEVEATDGEPGTGSSTGAPDAPDAPNDRPPAEPNTAPTLALASASAAAAQSGNGSAAAPYAFTLAEDSTLQLVFAATDPEGKPVTLSCTGAPAFATLSAATKTQTLAPADPLATPADYSCKATDGKLNSNVLHIRVAVTPVNDAPSAVTRTATTVLENLAPGAAAGTLAAVDSDAGDTHTFALVSGTGDTDNAAFVLTDAALITAVTFDYEAKPNYSIRVRATDADGLSVETVLVVPVGNANEDPTDLSLSTTQVAESAAVGAAAATITATDPDAGDTFTFALVAGTGSDDNAAFAVVGNQLRTAAAFDYETRTSYSVRLRVTDAGGLTYEEAFTLTVTDANDAPTAIALSASTVAENAAVPTAIGNLSATDQDPSDTFTYALVTGTGSDDNASFAIVGAELRTAVALDYEAGSTRKVRIRVTDAGGLTNEQAFTVTVTDANDAPSDLTLSNASVAENAAISTVVGTLAGVDQDAGETFTYALASGTGSDDNAAFVVVDDELRTNAVFDRETKSSYSVRIRVTDAGSLFFEKALTITVLDVPEPPTDITLTPASVAENAAAGTTVGTLAAVDPEGGAMAFALVSGAGSDDNAAFAVVGSELRTAAAFDFETKTSYSVRVQVTDSNGHVFAKALSVTITNVNEAPTGLDLSAASIAENAAAGTAIGNLSAVDPDAGDTFTYTLVPGTGADDNAAFAVVGAELRNAAVFDYETKSSYTVRVRATDAGGLFYEKAFAVTVTDESASISWTFDTAGDYTYDSSRVAVAGGVAALTHLPQSDASNDATTGFAAGLHNGTTWDGANSALSVATTNGLTLPASAAATGWTDMSSNVLLLRFDETAGGTAPLSADVQDFSGKDLHATNVNGALYDAAGRIGRAMSFNGSSRHLTIPTSADLDLETQFTVAAWVYPGATNNTRPIVSRGDTTEYWYFGLNDGNLTIVSRNNAQITSGTSVGFALPTGQWVHVAAVVNSSLSGAARIRLFVNGAEIVGASKSVSWTNGVDSTDTLAYVGYEPNGSYNNARIDELAVWRRALTPAQIHDIAARQGAAYAGVFESRTMDAGLDVAWSSLAWTPLHPLGKPLPSGLAAETAYAAGNLDMANAKLYLRFDDASIAGGGTVADSAGSLTANVTTNEGSTQKAVLGRVGGGIELDGVDDLLTIADTTGSGLDFATGDTITFAAWVQPFALPASTFFTAIVNKATSYTVNNNIYLGIGGNGANNQRKFEFGYSVSSGAAWHNFDSVDDVFSPGQWVHVAFTYTYGTGSSAKMYVNGESVSGTWTDGNGNASFTPNNETLRIGRGSENDHFNGVLDELVILKGPALGASAIRALYRRGAARAALQVRTCAESDCNGVGFRGPDGTSDSRFSELGGTLGLPSHALTIPNARYFQYRIFLDTDSTAFLPRVNPVSVGPDRYFAGDVPVVNAAPLAYKALTGFAYAAGAGNAGSIKFQLSPNGGTTYYHYDGGWTAATSAVAAEANTAAEIDAVIASLPAGNGQLKFRAVLTSSGGTQAVELSDVTVGYEP